MSAAPETSPTLASLLDPPWTVGEPDVVGPLVVFPLLGGGAPVEVLAFSRAVAAGVEAKELPEGPSVNDIVIENPTGSRVLLLDGEEVIGAQQDRVFDGSVIVPAREGVRVAVCCVERGRWEARGRGTPFAASPQVSHPRLRGTMASVRDRISGRTDQHEVWSHVEQSVVRTGTMTGTYAMSHVYRTRKGRLDAMTARVFLRHEQRGAVAFVGGRFAALDWVASDEAYLDLHPRLVRGYAFDAAEGDAAAAAAPSALAVEALLAELVAAPLEHGGAAGAARRLLGTCPAAGGVRVTALEIDGRLAQVSALRLDAT